MEDTSTAPWLRSLPGLAVLAVALPLVAACGDDEVAQDDAVEPPAVQEGTVEPPAGDPVVSDPTIGDGSVDDPATGGVAEESGSAIEETLEETDEAIEAVPTEPATSQ